MSWASRRRAMYGMGTLLFFVVIIGVPTTYWYLNIPETCTDRVQNQGETSPDRGGPCSLLDGQALSPASILWARSFSIREGSYNSVAYIQNTNDAAGIRTIAYRFALYDSQNVLVAERDGSTFVMPGGITPVFESSIQTGNRIAVRTYVTYREEPVWERMADRSRRVLINDKDIQESDGTMLLTATARNMTVQDMIDVHFVAVVFDQAGNAFATSQTNITRIRGGEKQAITFTWPEPFTVAIGRIDIIPLVAPIAAVR